MPRSVFRSRAVLVALAVASVLLAPRGARAGERVEKARALAAANDCDQLLLSFENAKAAGADDVELAKVLANAAAKTCAADKVVAFSLASAARRLAPKSVEVLLVAGAAALAAGQPGEAADALDRAVASDPSDPRPRIARAELALTEGEPAAAAKVLAPIKGNPRAAELLAKAQKARGESEGAKKKLYESEKTAMNAAARAKAMDSRPARRGAPEADDGEAGGSESDPGEPSVPASSSGKQVLATSVNFAARHSERVPTRKGRTYRVTVSGSCTPLVAPTFAVDSHSRIDGADLRIRLGTFEHGLSTDKGIPSEDDFDFVAAANGTTLEAWNADMDASKVRCSATLTIVER